MSRLFKNGITFGCWDLLHPGHMLFLSACMDQCESLTVGLHHDPSIERREKNSPCQTLLERYIQLDMFIREYDRIVPYEIEEDIVTMLNSFDINVRFIGSDYAEKDYTGKGVISTVEIPRDHNFSSSALRERIYDLEVRKNRLQEL